VNFPAVDEYENEPTASNYYRRRTNIFRRSNGVITTGVKQTLVTAWQAASILETNRLGVVRLGASALCVANQRYNAAF
jgi:hypothetical protein